MDACIISVCRACSSCSLLFLGLLTDVHYSLFLEFLMFINFIVLFDVMFSTTQSPGHVIN